MNNSQSLHSLESTKTDGVKVSSFLLLLVVVVVVGAALGFSASMLRGKSSSSTATGTPGKVGSTAGIVDKTTFKDTVTGILKEGGIDGEGNFHLERPGGVSQNAYLTSSTVDLTPYIGKKVQVWGQTFSGQKAGWLMDVGSIQVLQ